MDVEAGADDVEMPACVNGVVVGGGGGDDDWGGRWNHLRKVLERHGPFLPSSFEPSPQILPFLRSRCRILVVGAGGLGCELLKNLALMGFRNMDVIDMDTIDVSNLNRQFLFRPKDVGRFKAEVAAEFINKRIPGTKVVPHNCKIQEFDEDFYRKFQIVVCGLDSVVARRWINSMVMSLLEFDDDDEGAVDPTTIVPIIDGGTEGFMGNARVILPSMTACIECTLDLFPPQLNFPLCTIANTPRLPEHCIEYVRILLWPKENPYGEDVAIDGDDPAHIAWILEKSQERASLYSITGVTHRLTQGVVKRIIPAVASTNAVIAAACATEVFKVATSCANPLQNYLNFNDADGIYTYVHEAERKDDCLACSQKVHTVRMKASDKLQDLIDFLKESAAYRMKGPGLTTSVGGRNKTLYLPSVASIEEATRGNLRKTLAADLGLESGAELIVADPTTPRSLVFKLIFDD